jgi:hypothetical protein
MSLNRYAKRRDGNEAAIVAALEAVGCQVERLDRPVDLLVGFRGQTFLIEVKDPRGRSRLQDEQEVFLRDWSGGPAAVVRSEDEALRLIGAVE